ncbi:ABC transporter permease [Snodgrassella alvi]|jgi:putative ABC transport system permease protein|nr:iron export ABC transporter permease subunit FetB [Snodgrassella alvi]
MMQGTNYISIAELVLASLLILVSAGVSLWLKLGLTKRILVSAVRAVVQLSILGLLLKWIFAANQWYWVLLIIVAMTVIAGFSARSRGSYVYHGLTQDALSSVWLASWLSAAVGLYAVLHIRPWYSPQYVIPILGMVLGNCLTAVALCLDRLTQDLRQQQARVEVMLSMGATGWEAYRDTARAAVVAGMLPTINQLSVVGLVSLPGMITGQILAGASPDQAIRFQLLTMFLICAGSAGGCLLCAVLVYRRVFGRCWEFCSWRLQRRKTEKV